MATVAMIREAARLLEHLEDTDLVQFIEVGSEGAVLRINAFAGEKIEKWSRGDAYLIARNGESRKRPGA